MKLLILFCLLFTVPLSQATTDVIFSDGLDAVLASSFGYDENDATSAFTQAITSQNRTIIIDTQAAPWIISPTSFSQLQNKTIVFQPGVVLYAKPGAFDGTGDNLIRLVDSENVKLIGNGATLRMNRSEYAKLPGEWRHAVSIRNSKEIEVRGFTIEESGGDAVYIGDSNNGTFSENILIRDLFINGARRQGISVITAQNLCIDNVEITDIAGRLPESAIDFEPNFAYHRLVNITLSNLRLYENNHAGLLFALGRLTSQSLPISIDIDNVYLSLNHDPENDYINSEMVFGANRTDPVGGVVNLSNLEIDGSLWGMLFSRKPADAYQVNFNNVMARNISQDNSFPPVFLETPSYDENTPVNLGGFDFQDVYIQTAQPITPVRIRGSERGNLTEIRNITGVITVVTESLEIPPIEEILLDDVEQNNYNLTIEVTNTFPQ